MTASASVSLRYSAEEANPHYLQRVVRLSDTHPVLAREDIYDTRGFKLLPKGAQIDDSVFERLLRYRLHKPIESMLGVEDAITAAELGRLAEELMDANAGIGKALTALRADSVAVNLVRQMKLDAPSNLMLSLQKNENARLRHGMMVALLAVGLGYQSRLPDAHLAALAPAGVLHDIGELYVDPAILYKKAPLDPVEWRHIACHPVIGEMVIRETMHLPRDTGRFVAEHHERVSGYGYPRMLSGTALSRAGTCLGAAEVAAGIVGREGYDLARIGCALRLIQGEYPGLTVSLIDQAYRALRDELGVAVALLEGDAIASRADEVVARLSSAIEWVQGQAGAPQRSDAIYQFVRDRLLSLRKAAYSVGIMPGGGAGLFELELAPQEFLELQSVCEEIGYRLEEVSYLASLHPEAHSSDTWGFIAALAEHTQPAGNAFATLQ